ncbi:hypothetical protein OESDEN_12447 [Oesophagostomum dentatum]|uniref:Galectin n=1 Tax=Oesophagostomum dentatum TaxID=61180 RepID=A0A0B1SX64_OESDE|nr:hypothetical protein OESDEN_12447 [Oesophagostomum dentatum]
MQLATAKDIAILVTVPIAKHGKITASARIDGKFTSEVDKPIFVPAEAKFTLHLRIAQFVVEIYYNDDHLLDFVHRANPMDIKEVHIEGPLIVEEVVFSPPQGASLDPAPSYEQATSMGSEPVKEFRHLTIGKSYIFGAPVPYAYLSFLGPPSSSLTPTPAPSSGTSSTSVLIPTPGPPQISQGSSHVVNQPIAGIPLPAGVDVLHRTPDLTSKGLSSATTSTNPFSTSLSAASSSASPSGSTYSKPPLYDKPSLVPTAFEQARNYANLPTTSPYVTSPIPTPPPATTSSSSSAMTVLQPTSFQQIPVLPQQSQPTPYPSSSQAMQPLPSAGPVLGMPYPQMVPQYQTYTPGVNPYQYQQYPPGVPAPPGAAASFTYAMHPHYNAYQQPYQYAYPPGPYSAGYPQSSYPGYPIVYAPGCHVSLCMCSYSVIQNF